ncbi:MAG: DEAD/DEAH box helicase [Methylococcaceae bacterium]
MNNRLLKFFNILPLTEQTILLALAVIYAPINHASLQLLLKSTDGFDSRLIPLLDRSLQNKLQKNELLVTTQNGDWHCQYSIAEELMRLAVTKPWFVKLAQLLIADNTNHSQHSEAVIAQHRLKKLRVFLYQGNDTGFAANLSRFYQDFPQYFNESMQRLFFNEFDSAWFASLSLAMRFLILKYSLEKQRWTLQDTSQPYSLVEKFFGNTKPNQAAMVYLVLEQRLLRSNFNDTEDWLVGDNSADALKLLATWRFMQGDYENSRTLFQGALKQLKLETGKRDSCLTGLYGYFYHLSLLQSRKAGDLSLLKAQVQINLKQAHGEDSFHLLNTLLLEAVDLYQSKTSQSTQALKLFDNNLSQTFKNHHSPYEHLGYVLLLYWLGQSERLIQAKKADSALEQLAIFCQQSNSYGYGWYTAVSALLLQRLSYKYKSSEQIAKRYIHSSCKQLLDLLPQLPSWERALQALTQLTVKPLAISQEVRLCWLVTLQNNEVILEAKEQRLNKSGRWTKGRLIPLKRLATEQAQLDYLSVHDKKICATIITDKDTDYYNTNQKENYRFGDNALLAAVGHPHIYWAEQNSFDNAIDISITEPQLLVQARQEQLYLCLIPNIQAEQTRIIQKTTSGLLITLINDSHRQVASILGEAGLIIPLDAKEQVLEAIASVATLLTVQSDIGGSAIHADVVEADSRLHLHLQPLGQGLQIEVFVQPFFAGGPLYKPAEGGLTVLAEIAGEHLQTSRDFELEKLHTRELLETCTLLSLDKELKWCLEDAEIALETLLQLQTLGDIALLEWPKGKSIKLSREAGLGQARFSVQREQNWFSLEGDLVIDDNHVIGMQELMTLLANSAGRFLTLDDGQIIALTQELRQRLTDLSQLGDVQQDKIQFHPLAAPALHEITTGMAIQSTKPWQEQLQRLHDLEGLNFTVPSSLQGELRDYQLQGFQWLSRLAYWGAGACLADDMGLGKTVQALALILSRAEQGATLILAPTSVCINWLEESARFAPSLKLHSFGSGDRQAMLDTIGAFDLVVCSYGLLQTEGKRLAQIQWHTLVADEAQAIKNHATKRSKAAMALQADFKLITTGTPIENHLGELWNLFNFINAGLLGSWSRFAERYAHAIESGHDKEAQQRLKTVLRPFILRRLKSEVLTELPARTEVTLHIELSEPERALYEALRRSALQTMKGVQQQPQGQQQLKILAEIMKLRRACCHPRLVMEESTLSSAKLQAFEELVDELLDNQHKALVFSQFVGHLTIIRELLDKKGIHYQYLDGSTPSSQRKKAVQAFQAGEGDLFLISLKAGGTGLNLTAADYVIHTDPWWNPAVEDQASDRAHRMGQQRPVTIYRLVAKNTIEDKIVALHHHKRDLANSLLEGGDISGKLSMDAMLALLKEFDEH